MKYVTVFLFMILILECYKIIWLNLAQPLLGFVHIVQKCPHLLELIWIILLLILEKIIFLANFVTSLAIKILVFKDTSELNIRK